MFECPAIFLKSLNIGDHRLFDTYIDRFERFDQSLLLRVSRSDRKETIEHWNDRLAGPSPLAEDKKGIGESTFRSVPCTILLRWVILMNSQCS